MCCCTPSFAKKLPGEHQDGQSLQQPGRCSGVAAVPRVPWLCRERFCRRVTVMAQLLARIERMERRVQLVKKDSEREKHRIFQGFEVDEKPEAETCEKLPLECPQDLLEPPPTLQPKHFPYGRNGKGHKRKPTFGSAERKTPVKKLVSEFSKVKSKTPKHSPGKEESSGSLSETVCKRELRSQETPEKPRSLLETPLRASAPPKGPSAHPKEKGFFSSETDDLPYLSTTEMYLCRWHQPPPSPLPLREPSPKKEETVASKRWRTHRGTAGRRGRAGSWKMGFSTFAMKLVKGKGPVAVGEVLLAALVLAIVVSTGDGSAGLCVSVMLLVVNLDDSVFAKRHAKLELDEKRRKRWDIQRIREQRILQRLQLRMYKRKGIQESEPEVTSFFPEPDDARALKAVYRELAVLLSPPPRGRYSPLAVWESEDGIEGDAVLSDYESAEDSEAEEEDYSEEESAKVELKHDSNDSCESAAKAEKGDEKPDSRGAVTGERQSGDGQESTEPVENKVGKKVPKHLENIPRKGLFFEHDLRGQTQEEEVRPKGRQRKLWKDEGRWEHDKFREDEQAPKTRQELIALYGYDIRSAHNPDDIKPRRMRKPRFGSPPQRDPNWSNERPNKPPRHQGADSTSAPPRTFTNRSSAGTGRMPPPRNYPRMGGYKETRPSYRASEASVQHLSRNSEQAKPESGYRAKRVEQTPPRDKSPEMEAAHVHGSPVKEEVALENQAAAADAAQPPPDRPIEKKSYSRARRTRIKAGDAGKLADEAPASEGLNPVPPKPVEAETSPLPAKSSNWESPVESNLDGLEQEVTQMNLTEQNWTPGQSQFLQPRELRGIPNHMHVGTGPPPQFNRMEEMAVQGGRVKRYSSQRQRAPVPEPAPPMHISIMEGHYYDPLQFQGPIYTHSENPAPLPPQGMIVQPEMHLPHPGLHPHQTPAPMANPGLYPPPVSMPPGQPPPQQLLAPTYFSPPGVMNFGNPGYPYPPGALPPPPPPHLYSNTQAQSQVYGGVTYYNTVQQQVQPKPSPPRRTSQPVTIKPPPPEDSKGEKANERSNT
nr:protein CASC3 [Columba livia]